MTLVEAVGVLRRFWISVAFCVLGAIGIAAVYAATLPRVYVATSTAYARSTVGQTVGEAQVGSRMAVDRAETYADLASTGLVAQKVIDKLGLDMSPSAVSSSIRSYAQDGLPKIQISVQSQSPELALAIATAVADATAEAAAEVEGGNAGSPGIIEFVAVNKATLPTTPISPNVPRILGIGLLVGIALAWVVVLLQMRLDTRIRRPQDIEEVTETGIIGTIPKSRDLQQRLHSEGMLSGAVGEALRHLRTNLMFTDPDRPPRTIVVTSARPSEGKSTTAALLARAIAIRGDKVILIDGDLRRPKVAELFDAEGRVGLTQVLSRSVPLDEAIMETSTPGFSVLPAGRIPHNPSEVLGSERMRELIDELAESYLVIIDAPPTLPVTDALILAQRVDGLILVTLMSQSRKVELQRALALARKVNARVFGIVLNGIPQGRAAGVYGYETYGYGHDHDAEQQSSRRSRRRKRGELVTTRSEGRSS